MRKRIYFIVASLLVLCHVTAFAQVTLGWYEYWFDFDYSNHVRTASTDANVQLDIDYSKMTDGLHLIHFRGANSSGTIGQMYTYPFFIHRDTQANSNLAGYEYWLDDDYDAREVVNISDAGTTASAEFDVDVSGLDPGLHLFYMRAKNKDGQYGYPMRHLFYISHKAETLQSPIVGYRYGFNHVMKYISIEETSEYDMVSKKFTIPDIQDLASIGSNCTFDLTKSAVTMTRSSDICFNLSFVTKAGQWSTPEACSWTVKDTISKAYISANVNEIVPLDKVKQGTFTPVKFNVTEDDNYYLTANQYCNIDFYDEDFEKIKTLSAENLANIYTMDLSEGTYYAVVYNTVKDANYPAEKVMVRLSDKKESIADDVLIAEYSDGTSSTLELQNTSDAELLDASKSLYVGNPKDINSISYTRTFANTAWQPLYVPFALSYDDWATDFEVAKINALVQYDDNQDGTVDRSMLEIIKLKNGETTPNTPYFIRAKSVGKKTITTSLPKIYNTEVNSIDCSTTDVVFTFTGTYETLSSDSLGKDDTYIMSGGQFMRMAAGSSLLPYRWFLTVEDRNGIIKNSGLAKVQCLDDDYTGIENTDAEEQPVAVEYYTLGGARLSVPQYGAVNVVRYSDGTVAKKLIR